MNDPCDSAKHGQNDHRGEQAQAAEYDVQYGQNLYVLLHGSPPRKSDLSETVYACHAPAVHAGVIFGRRLRIVQVDAGRESVGRYDGNLGEATSGKTRARVILVVINVLTIGFLVWSLRDFKLAQLIDDLTAIRTNGWWIALAIVSDIGVYTLQAWRWNLLLH